MRVLIRCDGGPGLGVGHVLRSAALAEEAVSRGWEVDVTGSLSGEFLEGLLAGVGPRVRVLGPPPDDSPEALAALAAGYDVLHVDDYQLGEAVLDLLAAPGGAARAPRPLLSNLMDGGYGARAADLVIDPTPGAETRPAEASGRWSLRGARYIPIRRDVLSRRPDLGRAGGTQGAARTSGAGRTRVLVVMGGTDPLSCGPLVVDALAATGQALDVTVVAVPGTQGRLERQARDWARGTLALTPPTPDLPALMSRADLVVTAGGTSLWELCAMGKAMAAVAVVANQRPGYDHLVAAGAAVGLGGPAELADTTLSAARLAPLLADPAARSALARRASEVVDGRGAWRVVAAWEAIGAGAGQGGDAGAVRTRPVGRDDAEQLWRWRNDPVTRASSRTGGEIPLAEHVAWLESSLARQDRLLLLAEDARGPVGTVRWDHEGHGEWEVSITVAPERRGEGLARRLLAAGEAALAEASEGGSAAPAGTTAYLAVVHEDNEPSRRLFLGSGYLPDLPADGAGFARYVKLAS